VCQNELDEFKSHNSYYEENWKKYGFSFGLDDFETLNSRQYFCPICGATDRGRLCALYLTRIIEQELSGNLIKILDIAPTCPL
jgi:hypothetical protein